MQSRTNSAQTSPQGKSLANELESLGGRLDSGDDYGYSDDDEEEEEEGINKRTAQEEADRIIARHEKFLKDNKIVVPGRKNRSPSPPTQPMASRRFSRGSPRDEYDTTGRQTFTPQKQMGRERESNAKNGIRDTHVSPRKSSERGNEEIVVTPPPLSGNVIDTISREYGWSWLWWVIVPLVILAVGAGGYTGRNFYQGKLERLQSQAKAAAAAASSAAASAATHIKGAEDKNGFLVTQIASAFEDIGKIVLDESGALEKLDDSPFNTAVLPIDELRISVWEAEGNKSQPFFWEIDNFVAKNRDVDHAWRSFLQQQVEATAELAGIFDGYVRNAGLASNPNENQTVNWVKAAHNITIHDFSDVPQRTYSEGEQILCHILGKVPGINCMPSTPTISDPRGHKLIQDYEDLKKKLNKGNIQIPPKTFETYEAKTAEIASVIKSILKQWKNTAERVDEAKGKYNDKYAVGNEEMVVKSLQGLSKTFWEALQSPLIVRLDSPEYPSAIKRLAQSKIMAKAL